MKQNYNRIRTPLYCGLGFLISAILFEFIAIMILNNNKLVYTLDDPYIHMALAENIIRGNYGVNSNEFSAPSSSILWPFILAPLSSYEYFPLLLNLIFALVTVCIIYRILNVSLSISDGRVSVIILSSFLIFLLLETNIVGLVFTGMEHSLQVMLTIIIAYGLIIEVEKNKVEPWLLAAIIAAPLIRYENLSVSIAALGYLMMQRYSKRTLFALVLLVAAVSGFSLFLISLGLDLFPSSVAAKSTIVGSGGKLRLIITHFIETFINNPRSLILSIGLLGLLAYLLFAYESKKKQLAAAAIFAVFMHIIAGSYGWYNRYEIYIWSFFLLISLYLIGPNIKKKLEGLNRKHNLMKLMILAIGFLIVTASPYIYDTFTIPIAANNIYEQQYQMHRFAAFYYKKPVAVNDLGYVSYKNDNYVLDLGGIVSKKVLNYRKLRNGNWMKQLCGKNNVELVMIYDHWFGFIPAEWIKVGVLRLGGKRITPAGSDVAFYALNQKAYYNISERLPSFIKTLPTEVRFIFHKE